MDFTRPAKLGGHIGADDAFRMPATNLTFLPACPGRGDWCSGKAAYRFSVCTRDAGPPRFN